MKRAPTGPCYAKTAMLVDAYGSDSSDNNSGDEHTSRSRSPPQRNKFTSHSLPPSHSSASGSSNLNLPTPKVKRAPKKIAIDLPALPKADSPDNESEDARPAKKPRTDSRGAGSSTLFSKLPAPKLVAPVKATPERILGSGKGPGLVFNNAPSHRTQDTSGTSCNVDLQDSPEVTDQSVSSLPFTPVSVRTGKANVSLEGPPSEKAPGPSFTGGADIFSLSVSNHFLIHL